MYFKEMESYNLFKRDGNLKFVYKRRKLTSYKYLKEKETYRRYQRDGTFIEKKRWKLTMYLKEMETKNVFKRDGN
jgi:hypothetical protein